MQSSILEIHNILLRIASLHLHNIGPIDLCLNTGQCITLSGPSGSGKSLLLRAIADLTPHHGNITLEGVNQLDISPTDWRKNISYLPAKIVWWYQTVGEHFILKNTEQFTALGLDAAVLDWPSDRLSSGEQQRLGLLRLLQNNPRVLLLDEPTTNLDEKNTLAVEKLVTHYLADHQATAIWVSHDQAQLARLNSERYILENGQLTKANT